MFDDQQFSKDLKIQKIKYQLQEALDWELMQQHLNLLQVFPLSSLHTTAQKNAFWINVYNGVTNYLIVSIPIRQRMKEVEGVFSRKVITVQHLSLSLNDMEHGILRRNARNHLGKNDPILNHMVTAIDYRIHFALNCGATSCPPIAFYESTHLDTQLAVAEDSFVADEFKVDPLSKTITCSKIFQWYQEDFGIRFLNDQRYKGYEVVLKEYDWTI